VIHVFQIRSLEDYALTPIACECQNWHTISVFINFEYESNDFCKYGKGEICWHGVEDNHHDLKKKFKI
jgi:hypothetical protein